MNNIAEKEKQKALEQNLPDPYFDFRDYYTKGEIIFYVYINELIGTKQIIKIKVRSIYARTLVGYEENACCHMIGYNTREQIFHSKSEAEAFSKAIQIVAKYS